jgi:methylaspartate mutase sigma subunit
VVANQLLERFLVSGGYRVHNLGVCTPSAEIAEAAAAQEPLAVVIGGQNGHALGDLADLRDQMAAYGVPADMQVYVGGNLTVGADKSGMDVAAAFARIGLTVVDTFEALIERLDELAAPAAGARPGAVVGN